MIKTILFTLALVFAIQGIVTAQETFTSKVWAFSMQEPKGWEPITKKYRDDNIDKFEFSEETLKSIMVRDNGFSFLTGYRKYDPETHEGLIPGIQVAARRKASSTFVVFKEQIVKSTDDFNKALNNFKVVEETDVDISGIKAVKSIFTFTVTTNDGQVLKARSRIYSIPRDTYFFQITFYDGTEPAADCSAEFDALVKTISITR